MAAELLSDEALSLVRNALAESPVIALRRLKVAQGDTSSPIEITGQVKSFYHKQLAQEVVRSVADGRLVCNRVSVESG